MRHQAPPPVDMALPVPPGCDDRPLVAHVVRQFRPNRGGLEDFVANLAAAQRAQGLRVRVVTLDRLFVAPTVRLPARETIDGIDVVRVPFAGSTRYPLAPGYLRGLAGADLVHVHAVDFFFDATALLRPLLRRPLVATTHGGFFHTGAHGRLKRLWFAGPTRFSCRAYDAIVACGASDAALFAPIAGDRLVTIDNGVDIGKFAGRASAEPRRTIVTIGRFSVNKRLDRLLDAFAVLAGRDPRWRLELIGVPSDWDEPRVRAEIAARGLAEHVALHVGLSDADVACLIGRASLFASASEYEGFGIALLEGMSAGLAPVVQPNPSFRALAAAHPDVVLSDFADAEAAADALETAFGRVVAGGDVYRARLQEETRRYSWQGVAAAYGAVYDRVLGRPVAGAAPSTGR